MASRSETAGKGPSVARVPLWMAAGSGGRFGKGNPMTTTLLQFDIFHFGPAAAAWFNRARA